MSTYAPSRFLLGGLLLGTDAEEGCDALSSGGDALAHGGEGEVA